MNGSRRVTAVVFFVSLFLCAGGLDQAFLLFAADDGFTAASKAEGAHFTVFLASGVDAGALERALDVGASDTFLAGGTKGSATAEAAVAGALDTVFVRISDILDMRLYSFRGNIKVCSDYRQLQQIYKYLFEREIAPPVYSFYVNELNTVYISAEHFTLGILAHEMAHAIISRYFVVQPSLKIQEVLAGYAEYQLRKEGR